MSGCRPLVGAPVVAAHHGVGAAVVVVVLSRTPRPG